MDRIRIKQIQEEVKPGLGYRFTVAMLWVLFSIALALFITSIPDVQIHWSTSKDECVKVIVNGKDVGCEELRIYRHHLPERTWVK